MRRLLAVAAIAAAFAAPTAASADHYWRECGGVLDTNCSGWTCPTDCWRNDCAVWIDPLKDPMLARCIGPVGPFATP